MLKIKKIYTKEYIRREIVSTKIFAYFYLRTERIYFGLNEHVSIALFLCNENSRNSTSRRRIKSTQHDQRTGRVQEQVLIKENTSAKKANQIISRFIYNNKGHNANKRHARIDHQISRNFIHVLSCSNNTRDFFFIYVLHLALVKYIFILIKLKCRYLSAI